MPAIAKGQGMMLRMLVEGHPVTRVSAGSGHLALVERRGPERVVGFEQQGRIVDALGQPEESCRQLLRRLCRPA